MQGNVGVLTIIPFPHGLSNHVGWRGDVLEEQVEGLVCALARRYEHRSEEKATNTVHDTLLGRPDRARACCGELRRRQAPG